MHMPAPRAMRAVRALLTALILLNWVAGFAFVIVFAGSFAGLIDEASLELYPGQPIERLLVAIRAALLIALLMVPAAHVLLTRLRAITDTVEAGDPFVAANAGRLTTIAWSLLAIQLLDLVFGAITIATGSDFDWSFGLTGWLAVILLFVLARVFDHGTRLREELEGTV